MKKAILILVAISTNTLAAGTTKAKAPDVYQGEDIVVYSDATKKTFPDTTLATPTYKIEAKEVNATVNATSSEDFLRYSPNLLIRKRFMGDPNGNIGIRGSNVFQTAHTMVFGDGMLLSNPLRTTFNGAPRWSMVSPSEIASAEVLYGPFSAQYGGNSFGGVVTLNTKMPEKFEAEMSAMGMFQDVHRSGRNETLSGYKTFISAGDKIDKFSIWTSYNRLENEGQPMTINTATPVTPVTNTAAQRAAQNALPRVTGGEGYSFPDNTPAIAIGDIGVSRQTTDLFKMKMAYDLSEELQARFTIAYEERQGKVNDPNSLLRNPNGTINWGGATAAGNTAAQNYFNTTYNKNLSVPGSLFSVSDADRKALNYGLSLKGKITDNWSIDTTASYYDAFKDRTVSSLVNPGNPLNRNLGQITDEKPWWATYDLKLATDNFLGRSDLSFMGGYQFNHASLNAKTYNSSDYRLGNVTAITNDNNGATQTNSFFSQLDWRFIKDWSFMAGARADFWQALDGHVYDYTNPVANLRIQNYQDRSASRISPKASLSFTPDAWTFRYSFSKAYRFPIAEEMFSSVSRLNSLTIATPGLGPENGYFNNFMVQYDLPGGYVRGNLFYDQINDEIANTQQTINGRTVTTFLPIGQTQTAGVDLTYSQTGIFHLPVDVMANTTIMDKQIRQNPNNPALIGNQWDRIPHLQINATVTYHILPVWETSVGVRYRSDSFQRLDNTDTAAYVMGGTDESTFVDLKTVYDLPFSKKVKSQISAGIDNVFDKNAFENHPYPQRTFFVGASVKY